MMKYVPMKYGQLVAIIIVAVCFAGAYVHWLLEPLR